MLKQLPALEQKSDGIADDPLERVNFIFAVNQFFRVNVSITSIARNLVCEINTSDGPTNSSLYCVVAQQHVKGDDK